MNIGKVILVMLVLLTFLPAMSQTTMSTKGWEVIEFKKSTQYFDATLNKEKDNDSTYCAVIKIRIPSRNVEIAGDQILEEKTLYKNGYWIVYAINGASRMRIIIDGVPHNINFNEIKPNLVIESLCTYEMDIKKAEPNHRKANLTALAYSIVPGIGLIQKGHTAEGVAYLVGDIALIGGGIGLGIYGKNQKKIMNDRNTTLDDYKKSKSNYDIAKTASYICYGAAAGVYIINLIRSYAVRPKPGAPLQWAIVPEMNPSIDGLGKPSMSLNLALTYNF